MSTDDLTGPERYVQRIQDAPRRRDALRHACKYCKHREEYWDVATCRVDGRRYPTCRNDRGTPSFEFDPTSLEKAA